MAKSGYYGGNPQAILDAPVNIVQSIIDYDKFEQNYHDEYKALNKVK